MNLQKLKDIQLELRKLKRTLTGLNVTALSVEIATITTLIGEVELEQRKTTKEVDILAKIKKYIALAEQNLLVSKTPEAVRSFSIEINKLTSLLPTQLTDQDISVILVTLITQGKLSTLGGIMTYFKQEYAGMYDNKKLSKQAKELLK